MNATQTIDQAQAQAVPLRKSEIPDDRDMLRTAAELTRDIAEARPEIYWPDMLASALIGYGALAATIMADSLPVALLFGVVSVMALYRALLFIHELTHIHRSALPGFRFTWNLLVGIPMLTPSFGYEGVHTIHHSRMRYGTAEDPEYLPLALMKPWTLPLFILFGLLAPVLLIARFAVLVPLGLIIPPLRRLLWERFSALSINPFFRRRPAEGEFARMVRWQEAGASIWAIFVLAASALWLGWRPLLIAMIVLGLVATFNQLRTLVAHLWENDGERMTVTAQYLDSVNVPHWIAGLWAPVGLRYHATHHLLPSLPYHSLGEAHKRISAALGPQSTYQGANHKGMLPLVVKIARSSMGMKG